MNRIPADIETQVRERAAQRCEYCGMHQSLQGGTFHCEHVLPRVAGGLPTLDNMALACPSCNLHKAGRTMALDSETQAVVPLFHPRRNQWSEHFEWDEFNVVAKTAIGRAAVMFLRLNDERRIRIRQAERLFDLFPPD